MERLASKIGAEFRKRAKKNDGKFFQTGKHGEELKVDLNSNDKSLQKAALKQIIADMTLGRDVSKFFTEVVKLSWTPNMDVKKLVYLYLMANARVHPDTAILAVNTFVQDAQHTNPIVRALAIRTMLCIRVHNITDHVCPPLRQALKDKSEYVRKTAALGVLKLFHTNPKLCEEQGFVGELEMLVTDSAPVVVANAVLALTEIMDNSSHDYPMTEGLVRRLFGSMSGCTEWGQVSVLDFIARYKSTPDGSVHIVDRCLPRLHQSNPAVLLSAIRCILRNLDALPEEKRSATFPKITPPIVTLMSKSAETQYVTLRCVQLVLKKYPRELFTNLKDVKAFFCTYEDPVYVKLEKLDVLLQLLTERNGTTIVKEFEEYCQDPDPVFQARSVQALASAAVRQETCVPRTLDAIRSLSCNLTLVEPVLLAVKDILRKYPMLCVDILPPLLEPVDYEAIAGADAKCALVWALGEFGEVLQGTQGILLYFVESFKEQPVAVQLAVVTAVVKVFLRSKDEALLNDVLRKATTQPNADLRDRAYMYWRMLSNEKYAGKLAGMVIDKKPPVRADGVAEVDEAKLDELVARFNMVSSVYHKVPASFVQKYGFSAGRDPALEDDDDDDAYADDEETPAVPAAAAPSNGNSNGHSGSTHTTPSPTLAEQAQQHRQTPSPLEVSQRDTTLDDIFGTGPSPPQAAAAPPPSSTAGLLDDLYGVSVGVGAANGGTAPSSPSHYPQLLSAEHSDGLALRGGFANPSGSQLHLTLHATNSSPVHLTGFAIQFNTNAFGVKNAQPLSFPDVPPGETVTHHIPLASVPAHVNPAHTAVQVALKTSLGRPYYFSLQAPSPALMAGLGFPGAS